MKKRILFYILLFTMLLMCACGSSDTASGTLKICIDGNGMNEMHLEPIIAEFESKNPGLELIVEYLPLVGLDSAAQEERQAALTRTRTELMSGDAADIYLFLNKANPGDEGLYSLFPNLEQQIRANVLHDLDFLFTHPDFHAEEYVAPLQQMGVYEGKSYVLPLSYTSVSYIALDEPLKNSGFDEEAASKNTKTFMDEILKLSKEQIPSFAYPTRLLSLRTLTVSPVDAEKAEIQLNIPEWRELIELNRYIMDTVGYSKDPQEDFMNGLDYEARIAEGAVFLPVFSATQPPYYLRLLEDEGYTARLIPLPNEKGGVTMMTDMTAVVSAGCENTDAAAQFLLFMLSEQVQGCGELEQSGGTARMFASGLSWPVRKGCAENMLETMDLTLVEPGEISDTLKADLADIENRIDFGRLGTSYDSEIGNLILPYLTGEQTWEECYANIEKEWSYLDE